MTGRYPDDWHVLAGRAVLGTSTSATPAADARELLDAAVDLNAAARLPVLELGGVRAVRDVGSPGGTDDTGRVRGVPEGGPGGSGAGPALAGLLPLGAQARSELIADPDSFTRHLRTVLDARRPLGRRSPVAWHLRVASPMEPGDRLFRLGDAYEWQAAMLRIRGARPDRARELLEAEWWRPWSPDLASLAADSRELALGAFRVGLCDTDVPFLTAVTTRGAKDQAGAAGARSRRRRRGRRHKGPARAATLLLGEPIFHPGPEPELEPEPEPEPEWVLEGLQPEFDASTGPAPAWKD